MTVRRTVKEYKIFSQKEGYENWHSSDFSYTKEEGENILERINGLKDLEVPPSSYILLKSFSDRLTNKEVETMLK